MELNLFFFGYCYNSAAAFYSGLINMEKRHIPSLWLVRKLVTLKSSSFAYVCSSTLLIHEETQLFMGLEHELKFTDT